MLYENDFYASTYEELLTYYPRFYREVFEMNEILKASGRVLDTVKGSVENVLQNAFIDTADEQTIYKYEKLLDIKLEKKRTLQERRQLVKSFFVGRGKISAEVICSIINAYTDDRVYCRFEPFDEAGNNKLFIESYINKRSGIVPYDVMYLISLILPAHIYYGITFKLDAEIDLYTGLRPMGFYLKQPVSIRSDFIGKIKRNSDLYTGLQPMGFYRRQPVKVKTSFLGNVARTAPLYTALAVKSIRTTLKVDMQSRFVGCINSRAPVCAGIKLVKLQRRR